MIKQFAIQAALTLLMVHSAWSVPKAIAKMVNQAKPGEGVDPIAVGIIFAYSAWIEWAMWEVFPW